MTENSGRWRFRPILALSHGNTPFLHEGPVFFKRVPVSWRFHYHQFEKRAYLGRFLVFQTGSCLRWRWYDIMDGTVFQERRGSVDYRTRPWGEVVARLSFSSGTVRVVEAGLGGVKVGGRSHRRAASATLSFLCQIISYETMLTHIHLSPPQEGAAGLPRERCPIHMGRGSTIIEP